MTGPGARIHALLPTLMGRLQHVRPHPDGYVWFVGAGPGDPDLLTVRGHRALHQADLVLYDSLVDPRMLQGVTAETVFVGKRCGKHSIPQSELTELIAVFAIEGRRVARLKGGDPTVLGRVGEEALRLRELGIPFEIVPGVSSCIAAPAHAGIPVTHRGVADSVHVVTAHRKADETDFSIPRYAPRTTLVLLMSMRTTPQWVAQMLSSGFPPDLPVAFIAAATTRRQRVVETTLDCAIDVASTLDRALPTLAVVGNVVKLRRALSWFEPESNPCPESIASEI